MKNTPIKLAIALCLTIVSPSLSATAPLQDTEKAALFFADKLAFEVNTFTVSNVIRNPNQEAIIVDVRTADDYAKGHIPGSINIPYDKFNSFQGDEKEFAGLHKDRVNIIYCYTLGCNLAPKAALKFASLGYPVKEMIGGYSAWTANAKNPVEKGTAK
jgi:rhodanese-related sulfurtransferase